MVSLKVISISCTLTLTAINVLKTFSSSRKLMVYQRNRTALSKDIAATRYELNLLN